MMHQRCVASAPAKLILSGEYAVLDGAPAICMALDRRAVASVTDIAGPQSTVTAPDLSSMTGRFDTRPDGIEWSVGEDRFSLVDAVWQVVEYRSAATIELNTSDFLDAVTANKIGIGSSAALVVALCAACKKSDDVASLAQLVHSRWQKGAGSGVDVACSVNGGLIRYQTAGRSVKSLDWPKQLRFAVIWTGVVANTRDKLARLEAGVSKPSRVRLAVTAEALASAWCDGDTAGIVSASKTYVEHLREFDLEHGLDVFGAGHAELLELANAQDLVYKPCGAGGGDVGVVLSTDAEALDAFVASMPADFSVIPCALDRDGIRLEKV